MAETPSWLQNDAGSPKSRGHKAWEDPVTTAQRKLDGAWDDDNQSFAGGEGRFSRFVGAGNEAQEEYLVTRGFTCLHLASAALMYASAIVGFMTSPGFSEFFITLYASLFATILAAFELSQIYELALVELEMRTDFGFLYNHTYKGVFIVFIAFVNLGLSSNAPTLMLSTTCVVLADGVGLIAAAARKPEWFPTDEGAPPPVRVPQETK